ncbi:MAG: SHOCT domain-containing protein [Patescibacteria group bacterium]
MKKICPLCGNENEENARFCIECNEALINIQEPSLYNKTMKRENILMKAKGVGGDLELLEDKIRIVRRGGLAILAHGLKGDKEIFINQISSIQFRKAGALTNGYIQFAFIGGSEAKGGMLQATTDENTVFFNQKNEDDFSAIKHMIEDRIHQLKKMDRIDYKKGLSLDDLEKLAELKEKGIITEEEFQIKKRQILG